MKQVIIFCQAFSDVQYSLALYEQLSRECDISIYVINVKGAYEYLLSLGLKTKRLAYLPCPEVNSLFNVKRLLGVKKNIAEIWEKEFKSLSGADVYYFSRYFDWYTPAFIDRLSDGNTVRLCDHYGHEMRNDMRTSRSPADLLRAYMYKTATNVDYEMISNSVIKSVRYLRGAKHQIRKAPSIDPVIYEKYSVKINGVKRPSLLYFESDRAGIERTVNGYTDKIVELSNAASESGYTLYVKKHPSSNRSGPWPGARAEVVGEGVPGEFLGLDSFDAVASVDSVVAAKIARTKDIKVMSIIKLLNYKSESCRSDFIKYIDDQSGGKVKYVSSFGELFDAGK